MQENNSSEIKSDLDRPLIGAYDVDLNNEDGEPTKKVEKKPTKDHFWRTITIFVFVVALLRLFVMDPFLVHGSSMEPTFDEANYVIVDKITYKLSDPRRGDVIVFDAPTNDGRYFIKRVIGLPGERIVVNGSIVQIFNSQFPDGFTINEPYVKFESNRIYSTTLANDEYFVMGDNREVSSDSRLWGPLKKSAITGRALLRLLPFSNIALFPGNISYFSQTKYPETDQVNSSIPNSNLEPKKTL